jgi:diaminopimelate epimerase
VFDAVVTPALWGEDPQTAEQDTPTPALAPSAQAVPGSAPEAAAIDCSTACVNGCIRPDACPSAEARSRVAALLSGSSLDDLVAMATNSLEARTRARFERELGRPLE